MERTIIILVVVVLILIGAYYLVVRNNPTPDFLVPAETATSTNTVTPTGSPSAMTVAVDIENFTYLPSPLTVKKGTTVTWTNRDTVAHDVVSVTGSVLKSPLFTQGQSFSYTFDVVGTYDYYCTVHPRMLGRVIVTE